MAPAKGIPAEESNDLPLIYFGSLGAVVNFKYFLARFHSQRPSRVVLFAPLI